MAVGDLQWGVDLECVRSQGRVHRNARKLLWCDSGVLGGESGTSTVGGFLLMQAVTLCCCGRSPHVSRLPDSSRVPWRDGVLACTWFWHAGPAAEGQDGRTRGSRAHSGWGALRAAARTHRILPGRVPEATHLGACPTQHVQHTKRMSAPVTSPQASTTHFPQCVPAAGSTTVKVAHLHLHLPTRLAPHRDRPCCSLSS